MRNYCFFPILLKIFYVVCVTLLGGNLRAESAFLLLQSKSQTDILSIKDKKITNLLQQTNYLQTSDNGNIVYQIAENSSWQCARLILNSNSLRLTKIKTPSELTNTDVFPAFSPDGSMLLWIRYKEGKSILYIWDTNNSKMLFSKEIPGYVFLPVWSPDGEKVVFYLKEKSIMLTTDDYGFAIFKLSNKEIQIFPVSQKTRMSPQRDWKPMWSHDSKYVFYEGKYNFSKKYFEILLDTVTGNLHACDAGLWFDNSTLIYLLPSDDRFLKVYLNKLNDTKNGNRNLTYVGEVSVKSFSACIFDQDTSVIYYQSDNRNIVAYNLKNNLENILCSINFGVIYMSILYIKNSEFKI